MRTARVVANRAPPGVRFLEHTADIGIEVRAPSVEACFARAAAGMFACFTAPADPNAARESVLIDLGGEGLEDLLLAWLGELLYFSEVKGVAFHEFSVFEVGSNRVRGRAEGPPFGPGAETTGSGVKAVTRHGLELRKIAGGWYARVIFDV
jgi:SHS2 domain-containing protein